MFAPYCGCAGFDAYDFKTHRIVDVVIGEVRVYFDCFSVRCMLLICAAFNDVFIIFVGHEQLFCFTRLYCDGTAIDELVKIVV